MDVSEYCRDLEAYLCQKNDGHLIRIVGPSFEIVSRWASDGVPLKVAKSGIDRYFERYYRKGSRRRPVRIDFCEADILDVFDEWRRATGITAPADGRGDDGMPRSASAVRGRQEAGSSPKRGRSLPDHLERVMIRLSSLRATGALGDAADAIVDAVSAELDAVRHRPAGVRGEERRAMLERLQTLDERLIATAMAGASAEMLSSWRSDAAEDLAAYRAAMAADAYERTLTLATTRLVRERLGLPTIAFA